MIRIKNIKLDINYEEEQLIESIAMKLRTKSKNIRKIEIVKKALDTRKKGQFKYVFTIDIKIDQEHKYLKIKDVEETQVVKYKVEKVRNSGLRPVIIGSGPAGLMSGLILAEAGLQPIIIEMGKDVDSRKKDIEEFWKTGKLNKESNVQFGAGGAGTFSDGKLTTGIKDMRRNKLLNELIYAGAPEDIIYLSKPHVGTDILIDVVRNICEKIVNLGGEIKFETKMIDFSTSEDNEIESITVLNSDSKEVINCTDVILAVGHSSRDTFELLSEKKVDLQAKPFSVGLRIEHLQSDVNTCQYGDVELGSAEYKVSTKIGDRGVYSFCMCPGGLVVASSSEENTVVTNGMSYYMRDAENANSALMVGVLPGDFGGDTNPLAGIELQRQLEAKAFEMGGSNYNAPGQMVKDYLGNKTSEKFGKVTPSYTPGVTSTNLNDLFPSYINESLKVALVDLGKKVKFFADGEAVLTGVESRSSSPVRVIRNDMMQSNIRGIYPCGEGAGYAGGIVSAGIDGIKCAEQVIISIKER